jgi:DEAD/DEAH box helicase domain-containing protein
VIRRLRRICRQYESDPIFIVASATIANPQQHAQMLIGVPYVHLVDQDTSPHGPQTFVFWNPPLLNEPTSSKAAATGAAIETLMVSSLQQNGHPSSGRGRRQRGKPGPDSQVTNPNKTVPPRRKRGRLVDDEVLLTVPTMTEVETAEEPQLPLVEATQPLLNNASTQDSAVQAANARKVISEACSQSSSGLGRGTSSRSDQPLSSSVVVLGALGSKKITDNSTLSMAGGGERAFKESRFQRLRREALQRFPSFQDWKNAQIQAGRDQKLDQLRRSSPIVEISLLLSECIKHGLRTIAFCKSRKLCELVATYTRETLKATTPHLANSFKVRGLGGLCLDVLGSESHCALMSVDLRIIVL